MDRRSFLEKAGLRAASLTAVADERAVKGGAGAFYSPTAEVYSPWLVRGGRRITFELAPFVDDTAIRVTRTQSRAR
jgi:hypothetical protein